MPKPPLPTEFQGLPVVTAAQAQALDHQATEKFHIPAKDLMERAGKGVADETEAYLAEVLHKNIHDARVVVACGRGSNGGDGLVAARHLREQGADVKAFLCPPKKDGGYSELVQRNIDLAKAAGVPIVDAGEGSGIAEALKSADVVVDALLGTGSSGKPAGAVHHMIQEITRSKKPVVAVDLPSGLHPDTGYHSGVYITAALTLTFGWAKRGLVTPHAQKYVGTLKVLDIGYPKELKP